MIHPQILQQFGQPFFNFRLAQGAAGFVALQLQHGAHVVLNVELAKNRGFLRQIAQAHARAPVNRHVAHRLPVDGDITRAGVHQAHNHVERGGLAGTIRAQQTDHFAFSDDQRHIFDRLATAVKLLQMANLQPAFANRRPPGGRGCRSRPLQGYSLFIRPQRGGGAQCGHDRRWRLF